MLLISPKQERAIAEQAKPKRGTTGRTHARSSERGMQGARERGALVRPAEHTQEPAIMKHKVKNESKFQNAKIEQNSYFVQ